VRTDPRHSDHGHFTGAGLATGLGDRLAEDRCRASVTHAQPTFGKIESGISARCG
jgi:hypothetical protein